MRIRSSIRSVIAAAVLVLLVPTAAAQPPGTALDPTPVMLLAGIAALVAFAAGAAVLAGDRPSERSIHVLLGLAAGVLVTAALARMLPAAFARAPETAWLVPVAFFGLLGVEIAFGGHEAHGHGHPEEEPVETTGPAVAIAALVFHRFIGGLSLPAAFGLGTETGWTVAAALVLHQVPDGLAAAGILVAAGWSRRRVASALAVIAIGVPVGALVGFGVAIGGFLPHLLAVSAATYLFIVAVELLPELMDGPDVGHVGLGLTVGIVLVAAVTWLGQAV